MGHILYDGTTVHFDSRTMAHLQIVIVQKFRNQESFLMSWKDDESVGNGRGSIWLAPTIPIYFKFLAGALPIINDEWLRILGASAETSAGLVVTAENGELARASDPHVAGYPGDLTRRDSERPDTTA